MASGPLRITPDSVTVYGEKARLDLVDHVSTVPVTLDDVHEAQHGVLRLRRIKGVRLSDEVISYELPVSRYVETLVIHELSNLSSGVLRNGGYDPE